MKANIVRIGNSRGIRIPKTVLEHCRLTDAVELDVQDDHLVIRSLAKPRRGWDEAFRRMHQHGDDVLLDRKSLPATKWDRAEWRW
jgi:antitoxin MazE